ncbi:MAG TPA: cytochrome P450 [Ktedonobacteraceae bacterium]|nr:cytochrome P450 [Ktedonobacteraceae bacterium]
MLTSQETRHNPTPLYQQLRTSEPLVRLQMPGGTQAYLLTRYDDALQILKDPRLLKDSRQVLTPEERQKLIRNEEAAELLTRHMLSSDGMDHTRLRNLVSKAFTPRAIERMRDRIQQITDELIDAVQEKGSMDLIAEFAFPLPITVISELLGIPVEHRQKFRVWTNALLNSNGFQDPQAKQDVHNFITYLKEFIAEKRANPDQEMVSKLIQADEAGDTFSEAELISMVFLLIIAGHETTVNLIGNGTLALLQHPDQLHKLQQHPDLVISAVEELLRYTAPVEISTQRWTSEDMELYGQVIPKGSMVMVSLLSANTDTNEFMDADQLDITRKENKHIAFGKGLHFCLGAPLARLEGQIAFNTLLRRLPDLSLDGDPKDLVWRSNLLLHGLNSLPVTF